jgi:hypothetical protein
MIEFKRVLRTLTSERFVAVRGGVDVAAVDLHYLDSGQVAGTVVLLAGGGGGGLWTEANVGPFLQTLDETLLPTVDIASGSLTFTVVHGEVWGNFEPDVEGPRGGGVGGGGRPE